MADKKNRVPVREQAQKYVRRILKKYVLVTTRKRQWKKLPDV